MELPQALREALERHIEETDATEAELAHEASALSTRYRQQVGDGRRLLTGDAQALAYAASRMPATYGAVYAALRQTLSSVDHLPESLLDLGAGTGAAAWAATQQLALKRITCVEREDAMRRLGSTLAAGSEALCQSQWLDIDMLSGEFPQQAELVIAAYVLNEMPDEARSAAIKKMWAAAGSILLLVEPGTPAGFSHIDSARSLLLKEGATVAAPCPHTGCCPMAAAPVDKHSGIHLSHKCHFSCRIARSRLHRRLKDGDAPYEDEKFTYIALSRRECRRAKARVLRRPQIKGGHASLEICTPEGIQTVTLSKKDGASYKQARKAKPGDELPIAPSS